MLFVANCTLNEIVHALLQEMVLHFLKRFLNRAIYHRTRMFQGSATHSQVLLIALVVEGTSILLIWANTTVSTPGYRLFHDKTHHKFVNWGNPEGVCIAKGTLFVVLSQTQWLNHPIFAAILAEYVITANALDWIIHSPSHAYRALELGGPSFNILKSFLHMLLDAKNAWPYYLFETIHMGIELLLYWL
jgi:hypothetical protein